MREDAFRDIALEELDRLYERIEDLADAVHQSGNDWFNDDRRTVSEAAVRFNRIEAQIRALLPIKAG